MTTAAREVLSDCRLALEMLQMESDPDRWRVLWAGAVALIRAIGHVLLNVDQPSDPRVAKAGDAAHRHWKSGDPKHAIYRDFIQEERNNILKEYRSKVHPLENVDVVVRLTLQNPKTGEIEYVEDIQSLDENLFRPLVEGYGEGEDARDIYQEALDWWDQELTRIDEDIAAQESST